MSPQAKAALRHPGSYAIPAVVAIWLVLWHAVYGNPWDAAAILVVGPALVALFVGLVAALLTLVALPFVLMWMVARRVMGTDDQ